MIPIPQPRGGYRFDLVKVLVFCVVMLIVFAVGVNFC